jgi:dTDP-4-amino-4,6-dideoxygalactose transaminase
VRLPVTERLFERLLLLPMHCELSDDQVDSVAGAIREYIEKDAAGDASLHSVMARG